MAGKIVDVTLRLIDKMSSPLNAVGGKLANSANQWSKAGKQIEKSGKSISAVGSKMTKSITLPIVGAGTACVKLASDFEAGMSKVQSIAGVSGSEMTKLSEKAKQMGAKTKFSATEATQAYEYMAMAGWKAKDMMDGIEGVMYLAGATGEDLASVSDIVTDGLTAFGMSAKDTEKFVNTLAKTASNSNTNVAMLGESFKYAAPVAGALGYNVQDVSTALGLMANSGIKASSAGTSLRSWMSRMSSPTTAVENAMKKLGISLTDSKGKMKSFDTIMKETRKGFSNLSESQKAQYASTLAGKSGMSGLLAIVNSSDKDFNKLSKAINKSEGACKDMYNVANNNLKGQLTILKSTTESLAISFGERLAPYVKKLTSFVQKLAEKFNGLSDKQKDTVIKVALVAAAIGPALLVFGKMVTSVGKVVSVVGKVGKAFKTFGSIAGIITSPAGIVIGVLAGIALAAFLIIKNWGKIKPVLIKVKNWFLTAIKPCKKYVDELRTTVSKVINACVKSFNKIKPTLSSMQKTFMKVFNGAKKVTVSALSAIAPYVQIAIKLFVKIAKTIGSVLAKAIKSATPVIQSIGACFNAVFPVIASIVTAVVKKVISRIQKFTPVFKVVGTAVGVVIGVMGDTISTVFDGVCKTFKGVLDFVTGVFTGNWRKAWEGVKSIFRGIFQSFGGIVKAPLNTVIGLVNKAIGSLNKVKVPDWVPGAGGKGINIPKIPKLAVGTNNWKGGLVQISERGGEIVDLPSGSRVYPHDESVKKAYNDGAKKTKGGNITISIPKLADSIIVREDADIDKIVNKLADKLEKVSMNIGGGDIGYSY